MVQLIYEPSNNSSGRRRRRLCKRKRGKISIKGRRAAGKDGTTIKSMSDGRRKNMLVYGKTYKEVEGKAFLKKGTAPGKRRTWAAPPAGLTIGEAAGM